MNKQIDFYDFWQILLNATNGVMIGQQHLTHIDLNEDGAKEHNFELESHFMSLEPIQDYNEEDEMYFFKSSNESVKYDTITGVFELKSSDGDTVQLQVLTIQKKF